MSKIRKITGAVVAMALVLMVTVVTFAFKADREHYPVNKSAKVFASEWYNVDSSSDNPADQEITGIAGSQPTEPSCNDNNMGNPCAVQISFDGAVPTGLTGKTVAEVLGENEDSFVQLYTREIPQ